MANLSTFRTRISSVVGLDNTASSAEQSLIDGWVNNAVVDVLRKTQCHVSVATVTTTADEKDYELPGSILAVTKIVDGSNIPLRQVTADDIFEYRRSSTGTTGSSLTYRYAVQGANLLMLYPTPSAADTLTFYYVARPATMATGTDDPSTTGFGGVPTEYHRAIELYAMWKAADYADDQSSQQGDRYLRDYRAEIAAIRKEIRGKAGRKLTPARMVTPYRFVQSDPSRTDPIG